MSKEKRTAERFSRIQRLIEKVYLRNVGCRQQALRTTTHKWSRVVFWRGSVGWHDEFLGLQILAALHQIKIVIKQQVICGNLLWSLL